IDRSEHEEVKFTIDNTAFTTTLRVGDYASPHIVAKVELLAETKSRSDFAAPTPRTDCVLKICARHFYLEKTALFRMSEYFSALFGGKYAEGGHEVVSIDDVDPLEFLWMLQASEGSLQITGDNVEGVLRVADRFLIDSVLNQCDHFLLTSPLAFGERLLLADRYSRTECFEKLLAFVRDSDQLKKIAEESRLIGELSRNGLEMLCEVALKLGHANGSEGRKPIF
ncbi:CRE-BTB-2 protein, partial [Aphelenchoides avenae]